MIPTFDQANATARPGSPFSNSDEGYGWMANWCDRCIHDAPTRRDDWANGCPLILLALTGKTPAEWLRQDNNRLGDQYHCMYFRPEDGPGDGEPTPIPDPPGQDALFPREPYTRPGRMYLDTKPTPAPVPA